MCSYQGRIFYLSRGGNDSYVLVTFWSISRPLPHPPQGELQKKCIVVCHLPPKTLILQTVETNLAKKCMRETKLFTWCFVCFDIHSQSPQFAFYLLATMAKKKENPYPIYDQNLRFSLSYYQKFFTRARTISCFWWWMIKVTKKIPNSRLECKAMPYFWPKLSKSIPYLWTKRLEDHTLWGHTHQYLGLVREYSLGPRSHHTDRDPIISLMYLRNTKTLTRFYQE